MSFRTSLLDSVNDKTVPMSRIADAVSRILRVKMRAGMWDKPMPSQLTLAGKQSILGNPDHRALAREAVRKSLVLLKNKNNILPLSRDLNVLARLYVSERPQSASLPSGQHLSAGISRISAWGESFQ